MKKLIKLICTFLVLILAVAPVMGQDALLENHLIKVDNHGGYRSSDIFEHPDNLYIGIGTENPLYELTINGDIGLKRNIYISDDGSMIIGQSGGGVARFDFQLKDVSSTYHSILTLSGDKLVGIGTSDPLHSLHVVRDFLVELDHSGSNPVLFCNEYGLVGIGNINPQTKLDVSGRVSLDDALLFKSSANEIRWPVGSLRFVVDTQNVVEILQNGNVGIGYPGPVQKLMVGGNIFTEGFILENGAADGRLLTCDAGGFASWIDQDMIDDGDWLMDPNGVKLYTLIGDVGIGTTDPLTALHVEGDIYASESIGIGVQQPEATLDVDGTIRVSSLAALSGDYKLVFSNSDGELFNDNIPLYDNMGNHFMEQDLITGNNWIKNDIEATDGIFIDIDGNVGIGTNQPDGKMEIALPDENKILFKASETNTGEVWIKGIQHGFGMVLEDAGTGKLMMSDGSTENSLITFYSNGKIGIGNTTPPTGTSHRLYVEGGMTSEEVVINGLDKNGNWPDYVFKPGYDLISVDDLAGYIKKNGHLPGIPTSEEIIKDGMNVYEMNRLLLEKLEELTLYIIKQQEEIDNIKKNLK